jgi:hypothetical protein
VEASEAEGLPLSQARFGLTGIDSIILPKLKTPKVLEHWDRWCTFCFGHRYQPSPCMVVSCGYRGFAVVRSPAQGVLSDF